MEVKINREIREYREAVLFGLSLRQVLCSVAAMGVAVLLHWLLRPHFGIGTVSWVCILGAAPFAALGFVRYHGLRAEQLLWAWLRSEVLGGRYLCASRTHHLYYELLRGKTVSEAGQTKDLHLKFWKRKDTKSC